jgi:hypothetical protein
MMQDYCTALCKQRDVHIWQSLMVLNQPAEVVHLNGLVD